METIKTILIFIILGISSGIFSFFIDFCFNEKNIFDFYYLFLITNIEPKYPKLAKMLGVCNVCFNFWFSVLIYIIYCLLVFKIIYLFYFLPFISFSCLTSMKLNKV